MKGNEKNDPNLERFQIIQDWCIKNFPSISSYIKVKIKNRQNVTNSAKSDIQFENERKDAHLQLKYELSAYKNKITNIDSSYKNSLNILVSQPLLPLGKLYYERQKMNLDVRKLLFSQQLIHKLKIKILTLRIDILTSIIDKTDKALELIDKSYDDIIIIIDKRFFEMDSIIKPQISKRRSSNLSSSQSSATSSTFSDRLIESSSLTSSNSLLNPNNPQNKLIYLDSSIIPTSNSSSAQSDDPSIDQYESLLVRLTSYSNHLSHKIHNYPKPLWAKDYSEFIEKSVNASLSRFDLDLSYLLPQECELSINRALFGNVTKSSEPIDIILRSFPRIAPNAFMIELMNMCYRILPQKLLKTFKPEQLSISLTFMFRVLFDRVYEKNFESEKSSKNEEEERLRAMVQNYDEKREKYIKMKKLPMSAFVWPQEYIPRRPFIVSHWDLSSLDENDESKSENAKVSDSNLINNSESDSLQSATKNSTNDNSNENDNTESNSTNSNKNANTTNDNNSNEKNNTTNDNNSNENDTLHNSINNNNNETSKINNTETNTDNKNQSTPKGNGFDAVTSDMPVRQFFRTDYYFSPAIEFLELANFCTNPIDTLYYIHKCLISVQKAAIIHSINKHKNREAKPSELNQVICFDDLFGLTLGVFLASDVPDIFALNWFVQNYSPHNELSPPLEYAKANLEGLTQHIANVVFENDELK